MRGKHSNPIKHWMAWLFREWLRRRIRGLVSWTVLGNPQPGCTAIIGMCSRLPDVLAANLVCLHKSRWSELRKIVIAVDTTRTEAFADIEAHAKSICPEVELEFIYYSQYQSHAAEGLQLPFVYCWLSWCIALAKVTTQHLLIHDYDALIVGKTLQSRYVEFVDSKSKFQGVSWYNGNGVVSADRLATTFEAFADTAWLRAMHPIALFNKMALKEGRSIDYDILLEAQDRLLPREQRTMVPMNLEELIHPSQMIHQYTMFRRHPRKSLPCFSMPMIPFFMYLSGKTEALTISLNALKREPRYSLKFLGDGTEFNFEQLDILQIDWALKQMVQGLVALERPPDNIVYLYGRALYALINTPADEVWRGDFTAPQRVWIENAAVAPVL
jgi:hypothetical protein